MQERRSAPQFGLKLKPKLKFEPRPNVKARFKLRPRPVGFAL